SPVLALGGHPFTDISAGTDHSCAVGPAGPYCWGHNFFGQLGDGSNIDRNTPVVVSGEHAFMDISAGGAHSCGLTAEGNPYCWGRNAEGALGDGTNTDSNMPVPVGLF
ncbi:MAG: RCC1 domain-containing protein, partial [Candidatus Limnocylindria bacterium]